jgi:hypothetical protein
VIKISIHDPFRTQIQDFESNSRDIEQFGLRKWIKKYIKKLWKKVDKLDRKIT